MCTEAYSDLGRANVGQTTSDANARQTSAAGERITCHVSHAVRNNHAGQIRVSFERNGAHLGNRPTVNRAGNGDNSVGTGVTRDRDRAVVGCVIVLGADRGGESHDYAKKYA